MFFEDFTVHIRSIVDRDFFPIHEKNTKLQICQIHYLIFHVKHLKNNTGSLFIRFYLI